MTAAKRLLLVAAVLVPLLWTPASHATKDPRHAATVRVAKAYAVTHPLRGFDTYSVRCGPRFCRWWLDNLDIGLTCTARPWGKVVVRCSRYPVLTPDPAPLKEEQ